MLLKRRRGSIRKDEIRGGNQNLVTYSKLESVMTWQTDQMEVQFVATSNTSFILSGGLVRSAFFYIMRAEGNTLARGPIFPLSVPGIVIKYLHKSCQAGQHRHIGDAHLIYTLR